MVYEAYIPLILSCSQVGIRAFITSRNYDCTIRTLSQCQMLQVGWGTLREALTSFKPELLQALSQSFGPGIRRFCSLGFQRSFARPGQAIAVAGSAVDMVHVVVSGRIRCFLPENELHSQERVYPSDPKSSSWFDVGPGETIGMTGVFTSGAPSLCVSYRRALRIFYIGKHHATSVTMRTSEFVQISTVSNTEWRICTHCLCRWHSKGCARSAHKSLSNMSRGQHSEAR